MKSTVELNSILALFLGRFFFLPPLLGEYGSVNCLQDRLPGPYKVHGWPHCQPANMQRSTGRIGFPLHQLHLCGGSVCQGQMCPISDCLPADVCKHSWICARTVTRDSCLCADLHPSCFMQRCCAHKQDSPSLWHSDFLSAVIHKTTGPLEPITNEAFCAVWSFWCWAPLPSLPSCFLSAHPADPSTLHHGGTVPISSTYVLSAGAQWLCTASPQLTYQENICLSSQHSLV